MKIKYNRIQRKNVIGVKKRVERSEMEKKEAGPMMDTGNGTH